MQNHQDSLFFFISLISALIITAGEVCLGSQSVPVTEVTHDRASSEWQLNCCLWSLWSLASLLKWNIKQCTRELVMKWMAYFLL